MPHSRRNLFPAAPDDAVTLRILATSDLHVHLESWDYYADRPDDGVGLARTATLIETARAEVPNCLLFDNGDFLQGNPLGEHLAATPDRTRAEGHAIIRAMNLLGYDAATLGNHEFNYGLDYLQGCLAAARFPVVSANALTALGPTANQDETLLPASVILDRTLTDGAGRPRRLRIGVIGVLPPQTTVWDRRHLEGRIRTRDMVEAVRTRLPDLRSACDLVILLAHTGIGPAEWTFGMENAALPLAALDGIDAIVTGHTHQLFPDPAGTASAGADPVAGTLHGKPAVMPGLWGSHLGVIDLALSETGGRWRVTAQTAALRPIATRIGSGRPTALVPVHAGVRSEVSGQHRAALARLRTLIGHTPVAVSSYFSLLGNDLALQTVMDAQADFVRARIAHLPEADLPLLSAAAPTKTGGPAGPGFYTDIPAGPLAVRHVADLYQFPNSLRAIRVTGADLLEWLERSAGLFARLVPGQTGQPLICPEFARYNFDVISGLTYRIDLSSPARHSPAGEIVDTSATRIRDLACQGRPVRLTDRFIVATNNYRADGGGGFSGALRGQTVLAETRPTQEILRDWIAARGRLADRVERIFGFAPLPGVTALYATGAGAASHQPDVPGLALDLRSKAADGSLVYGVSFPGCASQASVTT